MISVALAGASGLIGSSCLKQLLTSAKISSVVAVSRRPLGQTHEKLKSLVLPFERLRDEQSPVPLDAAICCLGTTMQKAGSRDRFYQVDFQYVLEFAKWTHIQGARQFLIVSALGSDSKSLFYYSRVKGQTEEALKALGFVGLDIFRPSLLLGDREEVRFGEKIAEKLIPLMGPLLPKAAQPIEAAAVAKALALRVGVQAPGVHIFTKPDMLKLGSA